MRRFVVLVATLAAAGAVMAPTAAMADNSNRPGGSITNPLPPMPANGGDQGWGNCGHNSSGGHPHTGTNGQGGGNGGHTRESCLQGGGGNDGGGDDGGGVIVTVS